MGERGDGREGGTARRGRAADADAAAGDDDDRDGRRSRKTTIGRRRRRSGSAGWLGRMRRTTEGSVADGGEGRGRRRRAKPIAWTEPAGGETEGTVGSRRMTTTSRLHPIRRLPGGGSSRRSTTTARDRALLEIRGRIDARRRPVSADPKSGARQRAMGPEGRGRTASCCRRSVRRGEGGDRLDREGGGGGGTEGGLRPGRSGALFHVSCGAFGGVDDPSPPYCA
jgi:hypothetical protein